MQDLAEDVFGAAKDARRSSSCRVVHLRLPAAGNPRPNTRAPPPTLHVKDVAQGAEMGAQLGSSVAAQWRLARTLGRRFRGCRAKRLYVHLQRGDRASGLALFSLFSALKRYIRSDGAGVVHLFLLGFCHSFLGQRGTGPIA